MVIYILVCKKFINLSFDYGALRCLDFSHILQSLYQLYAAIYSQVFKYNKSNGSRTSIVKCLFNPDLDFRYSCSLRIILTNPL